MVKCEGDYISGDEVRGQEIEEVIPYKQSQTIACTLNYLKYKSLVEKCLIDNSQHWRLRTLEQG